MGRFKEVSLKPEFPRLEERVLAFWDERGIFERSVERRRGRERFVFVEGPPTANGAPHPGHIMTRAVKDLVLRYKTMCGYYVPRKAGWDTHGLPVEIEVEKELGISNKPEIEAFGIEKFNKLCKESVFRYEREWVEATRRVGFWIDMENPYITFENYYIESVWWSLKEIWRKGLFYKGHKVVPFCPRCETPLSSHEVAQGYKDVKDPSIFVMFSLKSVEGALDIGDVESTYVLAWTTTPWTLLSNVALAVHPDYEYVKVELKSGRHAGKRLILAEARLHVLDDEYEVLGRFRGYELEGLRYEPLFPYAKIKGDAHKIVCATFVTLEEGTGVVHIAPAFGEDDYEVCKEHELGFTQPVDSSGRFTNEVSLLAGLFVKDADPKIIEMLEKNEKLYKRETYVHKYPFCWRCDSPLLYYARETWFIKMSELRDELLANNEEVRWYPAHLKHGRFGNFLENVVDWALSRERYWGTPLPIWVCERCGDANFIGGVEELKRKAKNFFKVFPTEESLDLHRPYVDELVLTCERCGGDARRVPDVIDCWYDSGAAPFAQWHYPFEGYEEFEENFPATFITEAIDQTRGWFYSLLAVSTAVFGETPYLSVLSLGHILDEHGRKMSKRLGNVIDPNLIFNREGADAFRWYFYVISPPEDDKRFYEQAVLEKMRKFLNTLWNVYFFFVTYANIDDFDPRAKNIRTKERSLLDRWLLSRLNSLIKDVRRHLDEYELHLAARKIEEFVVEELSNWYVRRSRRRFWVPEASNDKDCAYLTLYETLVTLCKLLAPFVPFVTEEIYQNLVRSIYEDAEESVHLCDYPEADEKLIDAELEERMLLVSKLAEAGRFARANVGIKIRQPLSEAIVVCDEVTASKIKKLLPILQDELNVKKIRFGSASEFVTHVVKPKYAVLGPKYKARTPTVVEALQRVDAGEVASALEKQGFFMLEVGDGEPLVRITPEDVTVELAERQNFAKGEALGVAIFINTELTQELREEGLVRDVVRRIQEMRKELDLEYTANIRVFYEGADDIKKAIRKYEDYVKEETLATSLVEGRPPAELRAYEKTWDVDGKAVHLGILISPQG
ncbi:MAG: Isoleucyl-tRNA synthetase [Candidatus Alkanophagales archaeon MCA70_species_2]|nr:Isoleucyl-tRNA synthetase [Candidatus Alkanophaga liquidiphilum]